MSSYKELIKITTECSINNSFDEISFQEELVKLVAEYATGHIEKRDMILDFSEGLKKLYFPIVVEKIKKMIRENVEQKIYEIIYNLENNNDSEKDRLETTLQIIYGFGYLSLYCAARAVTESKDIPGYKRAVERSIEFIEELVKKVKEETGCLDNTAYQLALQLTSETYERLHEIYHIVETDKFQKLIQNQTFRSIDILEKLENEKDEKKRKSYYQQLDNLQSEIREKAEAYISQIYLFKDARHVAAAITEKIYGNEKQENIADTAKEMEREIVRVKRTFYPSQFIMPITKVNNKLFEGSLTSDAVSLVATEKNGSKKELTVKVAIDFDNLEGVRFSRELEPFDRIVHDAVVSLYESGNKCFSLLMVYRAMTANPKAKLTQKQFKEISQSLNKLSSVRIEIDATDEAKAYRMDKVIFKGNLLYTKSVYVEHKGKVEEWFELLDRPILLEYAERKNQIDRVDIRMLATDTNKNKETLILQDYLLRRIRMMKRSSISRNIRYDAIYKQFGIELLEGTEARKKKAKIRETTKKILDFWKSSGEIKSYEENKGKNKVALSIKIEI